MIYNLCKPLQKEGGIRINDLNTSLLIGKLAVRERAFRRDLVGQLLGPITRISSSRVYYNPVVNGVEIAEKWTTAGAVAFVVDTEEEFEALDAYDTRRVERIDEKIASEAEDFRNRIVLHNSSGRGLIE